MLGESCKYPRLTPVNDRFHVVFGRILPNMCSSHRLSWTTSISKLQAGGSLINDDENGKKPRESKDWRPKNAMKARGILRRFVVRARRVEAHSMVQNHSVDRYAKPAMRIEFRNESPGRIREVLPDQEIFESLAARVRPCFLEQEPIYLKRVFGSIDLLLDGRRPPERDLELLDACRNDFRNLLDKEGGHYFVRVFDEEDNPQSAVLSDLLIGDGWLYGDLVHADPKKEKAEAMKLPYRERFFAATSLFSMLAVIVVRLLGLVTDLNERFGFGIDEGAWEEQVVLTDRDDDEVVSQKMVLLPYDTKLPEGVDPSTLPGAVDATSLTEFRRAIQPECAADAFFLHEKETIGEFHAIYSWKNGILTVLVADALLLEFDTTKKHGAEAYVNSSFTPNAEAVKRLLPTVRKSDLVRIVIPCGDGKNLYAIYPLAMAADDTKSDRG